ncbi:MAG: helicase-related protein, partial [Nitrososphaerales archaeon]
PALLSQRCEEFELPPMNLRDLDLREAIDHYAKYETPTKINTACRIAKEICGRGEKLIIWSTFIHNLNMIAKTIEQLNPVIVHGGVPFLASLDEDFSREILISRFRDDPQCMALIANPAACAESISLHKTCHHAIYLDRSFNCAHYIQSLDRIHRLGLPSDQKTNYYLLQSTGTIDSVVDNRLREKMRLMRDVIEDDLPGAVPGYWSEDLGDEETIDHQQVEAHIKSRFLSKAK